MLKGSLYKLIIYSFHSVSLFLTMSMYSINDHFVVLGKEKQFCAKKAFKFASQIIYHYHLFAEIFYPRLDELLFSVPFFVPCAGHGGEGKRRRESREECGGHIGRSGCGARLLAGEMWSLC